MSEIISFLGSIASLTGFSLKEVIESKKNDTLQRKLFDSSHPLLVRLEEDNDTLVGYWKLQNWDYESKHLPDYAVSGGLAVHHRDRKNKAWKAIMCLEYGIGSSGKSPRKWGQPHPFIATYNVSLFQDKNKIITGSCHMIEKRELKKSIFGTKIVEPKINFKWRGEFFECFVKKAGSARQFIGKYENFPKKHSSGHAEFVFHLPLKWGEITLNEFEY
jgi:hypothetical protein